MTKDLIKPQTLRGFRDYLPPQMIARERLIDTARRVYRSYGFSPIDTPALEYTEILLGKGGEESDKQLFRFVDQGGRDVAMRFDLTIPFARFAAQHLHEIGTPFKRYHIGTVWRGERPARGRFREFMQCDFDTIGTDSNVADIETLLVIHDLMEQIGFERFEIRVNNRMVLNGFLERHGLSDRAVGILRVIDKLPKIGRDGVRAELIAHVALSEGQADDVIRLTFETEDLVDRDALFDHVRGLVAESDQGREGVDRLEQLFKSCEAAGIPGERVKLDLSIARGLDYYTGTIYETFLKDLPAIGSVCSGGRYDNLAGLFTTQPLPGVGASLGLDRMLAAMEELGMVEPASTPAPVLVTVFDAERIGDYLRIGRVLRRAGIGTEVFPEVRPIGKQLKYASRKGFRIAVIAGAEEFAGGTWQVKDLARGEQRSVTEGELTEAVRAILCGT